MVEKLDEEMQIEGDLGKTEQEKGGVDKRPGVRVGERDVWSSLQHIGVMC